MRKSKELKWKSRMVREEIYDEPAADWLLLDTNGLLHPCCFKVLEEQQKLGSDLGIPALEELMFEAVIAYVPCVCISLALLHVIFLSHTPSH